MKRISTPAPDENFNSLKPLIGTSGCPPFYDPNDVHVHVWKKGKLGVEDNPKIPTYSREKVNIRTCEYCKICHKINKKFMSNVTKNNEKLKDHIKKIENIKSDNYIVQNSYNDTEIDVQILRNGSDKLLHPLSPINSKMFKDLQENYREYVKILIK